MVDLEHNMDALRANIKTSIAREKQQLSLHKAEVDKQTDRYAGKIKSIPRKERESLEIMRQQSVKASLYLFLLQKKEENYLSMTMVQPKAKVIDEARASNTPVSPKVMMIYMVALVLGLALPIIILYLRDYLTSTSKINELENQQGASVGRNSKSISANLLPNIHQYHGPRCSPASHQPAFVAGTIVRLS